MAVGPPHYAAGTAWDGFRKSLSFTLGGSFSPPPQGWSGTNGQTPSHHVVTAAPMLAVDGGNPQRREGTGTRLPSCWGKLSGNLWKTQAVRSDLLETLHATLWIDAVLLQAAIFKAYTAGWAASSSASISSWLEQHADGSVWGLLPALANTDTRDICCTWFLDKSKVKNIKRKESLNGGKWHILMGTMTQ